MSSGKESRRNERRTYGSRDSSDFSSMPHRPAASPPSTQGHSSSGPQAWTWARGRSLDGQASRSARPVLLEVRASRSSCRAFRFPIDLRHCDDRDRIPRRCARRRTRRSHRVRVPPEAAGRGKGGKQEASGARPGSSCTCTRRVCWPRTSQAPAPRQSSAGLSGPLEQREASHVERTCSGPPRRDPST